MPDQEQKFQKRQTAYKIRIKDMIDSNYVKTDGMTPNFLDMSPKEVSRINILGVVVDKSDLGNYKTITIDDGSGKVSARVFDSNTLLEKIDVGNIVLIIGRPREFSSEKYILIETVKIVNPKWAKVRELELEKNMGVNNSIEKDDSVVEDVILKPSNELVNLIKKLDKGEGVSIEEISLKNVKDVDKTINILLKEGDIFEVKPGKLKVLE